MKILPEKDFMFALENNTLTLCVFEKSTIFIHENNFILISDQGNRKGTILESLDILEEITPYLYRSDMDRKLLVPILMLNKYFGSENIRVEADRLLSKTNIQIEGDEDFIELISSFYKIKERTPADLSEQLMNNMKLPMNTTKINDFTL